VLLVAVFAGSFGPSRADDALTPLSGPFPDGATLVFRASTRLKLNEALGFESFGPAFVGVSAFRYNSTESYEPTLIPVDSQATGSDVFTVTALPQPGGYFQASVGLNNIQVVILKAPNGKYVTYGANDDLAATGNTQDDAALLVVNLEHPYALICSYYTYANRSVLQQNQIVPVHGIDFANTGDTLANGDTVTIMLIEQDGEGSNASFFTPFIAKFPSAPTNFNVK
jgi:hypothetical protein